MDAFEVGKHDLPIEGVVMPYSGVLDHVVRDAIGVLASEVSPATRASLLVGPRLQCRTRRVSWASVLVESSVEGTAQSDRETEAAEEREY